MKQILSLIFITILNLIIYSQPQPQINCSLVFSDTTSRSIYFGIDPVATDSIDEQFGEADLPPFPPLPTLEARFLFPQNDFSGTLSSYRDYRGGETPYNGQAEHRVKFQGLRPLQMSYNLPSQINIHVEDLYGGVLVNQNIAGNGSLDIPDVIEQLKLIITYNNATDISDEKNEIDNYILKQNYPNPFNPSTYIDFALNKNEFITLIVYDLLGKKVATLINGEYESGFHSVLFNSNGLASGIYFYTLTIGNISLTKSMILMK